jgi:hypothetical protein
MFGPGASRLGGLRARERNLRISLQHLCATPRMGRMDMQPSRYPDPYPSSSPPSTYDSSRVIYYLFAISSRRVLSCFLEHIYSFLPNSSFLPLIHLLRRRGSTPSCVIAFDVFACNYDDVPGLHESYVSVLLLGGFGCFFTSSSSLPRRMPGRRPHADPPRMI